MIFPFSMGHSSTHLFTLLSPTQVRLNSDAFLQETFLEPQSLVRCLFVSLPITQCLLLFYSLLTILQLPFCMSTTPSTPESSLKTGSLYHSTRSYHSRPQRAYNSTRHVLAHCIRLCNEGMANEQMAGQETQWGLTVIHEGYWIQVAKASTSGLEW